MYGGCVRASEEAYAARTWPLSRELTWNSILRLLRSSASKASEIRLDHQPAKPLWLIAAPAIFLVLWSGGFSVAKLGLLYSEPLTFLALRYAVVLAILIPLLLIMRPPLPRRPSDWGHVAMVGFLIQGVYFGLCYVAFKSGASAGTVAIIVCLQPILVGLIAPYFAREAVSGLRWLGLVLGLAGAATVILSRSMIEAETVFGVACAVGALFGMTAGTLWEKRFGISMHPIISNLIQYGVGFAAILPVAVAMETLHIAWTGEFVAALAYLVIANSLISMTLLLVMIRRGEVSRVSSLFYLVPPMTALIAWPLLGEAMPPAAWAGMTIAAVGVAIASRKRA
jgi:drug/metabolite transporter (DMT)-like permease